MLRRNREAPWVPSENERKAAVREALRDIDTHFYAQSLESAERAEVERTLGGFEGVRGRASLFETRRIEGVPRPFYLCFLRVRTHLPERGLSWRGRTASEPIQAFHVAGVLRLRHSAGWVQMRPERWSDRMAELLVRREVDLEEFPSFDRRYYVMASDEQSLRRAISPEAFHHLGQLRDLYIEVDEDRMLVEFPGTLSANPGLGDRACRSLSQLAASI
jgi:hypothetical protein